MDPREEKFLQRGWRQFGELRGSGHDGMERLAAFRARVFVRLPLDGLGLPVIATGVSPRPRGLRSHPAKNAVIREHKPAEERHEQGDDSQRMIGAKRVQQEKVVR